MNPTKRITSLATISEIFAKRPTLNRLILKQLDEKSGWEITKDDDKRPNNLRDIAERSKGRFTYERNLKRGFEAITGYSIDSDELFMVAYRLPAVTLRIAASEE